MNIKDKIIFFNWAVYYTDKWTTFTATAIPFIYSFFGNCAASAPISTFVWLWWIYIFPGSVHIFPPAEKADPWWEYIIRTQTHECGNWDWDPILYTFPNPIVLKKFTSLFPGLFTGCRLYMEYVPSVLFKNHILSGRFWADSYITYILYNI